MAKQEKMKAEAMPGVKLLKYDRSQEFAKSSDGFLKYDRALVAAEKLKAFGTDTVKAIAEELELKPALINKAISVAHKGNYQNIADEMDTLESILNTAGKL